MTHAELARENFLGGCNCAQAVLLAFRDSLPADEETLKNISRPFGGGMSRLRLTCGGFTGGAMALGLLFPELGKSELYALVREYARRYREKFGSYLCGELLAEAGVRPETGGQAEERTALYYQKRPCPNIVYGAAELLESLAEEQGKHL